MYTYECIYIYLFFYIHIVILQQITKIPITIQAFIKLKGCLAKARKTFEWQSEIAIQFPLCKEIHKEEIKKISIRKTQRLGTSTALSHTKPLHTTYFYLKTNVN